MNSLVERLKERGAFLHAGAAWGFDPDGYLMEQAAKEIERTENDNLRRQLASLKAEAERDKARADALERDTQALRGVLRFYAEHRHWDDLNCAVRAISHPTKLLRDEGKYARDALNNHPAAGEAAHRPVIEDEVWEGDPLYEDFPVKIMVKGVWFIREDHTATGDPDCCAKARADERERCARIADERAKCWAKNNAAQKLPSDYAHCSQWEAETIARAIRQGGNDE